jgi:hypothetical protein
MTGKLPLFPTLPNTTIVPQDEKLFIPYLNRLYEDIANTVNFKDNNFYQMAITNTPTPIVNIPNFGAFIICVSGTNSGLPTITASLCKADMGASGSIAVLGSQAGTVAPFAAATLTITSSATNFLIHHSVANTTGNFNLRVIGTQNG